MKLHAIRFVVAGFLLTVTCNLMAQSSAVPMVRLSTGNSTVIIQDDPFVSESGLTVSSPAIATTSTTSASVPSSSAQAKAEQKETLFMAELQKLKFDRRPSMILRAWAELEAAPAATKPSAASATAVNAAATPTATPTAEVAASGPAFDAPPRPLTPTQIAAREAAELAAMTKEAAEQAKQFQRLVTIGHWEEAAEILRTLKVANQDVVYKLMLQHFMQIEQQIQKLAVVEDLAEGQIRNQEYFEKNRFTLEDFDGLLSMAPRDLKRSDLATLGQIVRLILESGVADAALESHVSALVEKTPNAEVLLSAEDKSDQDKIDQEESEDKSKVDTAVAASESEETNRPIKPYLRRRQAAWLLLYCGQLEAAEKFLPSAEDCEKANDAEGLNMIARLTMAKSLEDDPDKLMNAWQVLQVVINSDDVPVAEKNEALLRAVSLVPNLDKEVGVQWLGDLFAQDQAKTKEILAVMTERVTRGMQSQPHDSSARGNALMMIKIAANTLHEKQPEWAVEWNDLMNLMASAWLREAKYSQSNDASTSLGPQLQRDQFGNIYYYSYEQMYGQRRFNNRNMPTAVKIEQVLDAIPDGKWFESVDQALRPEISSVCANMLLKVDEDERAFPYIEALAVTHPDKAQELAEQFLRVWTQNHDMNSTRGNNRYSPYYYSYGFNQAAESIPLTRSKQERNLKDLTRWVAALRNLEGVEVDQELLANAFTTCHSGAEVYRFEEIEKVFGPMQDIDPDVLAALCEKMRSNLAGQWLVPDVQKQNKTKRGKKDILEQVLRGYALAMQTLDQAIEKHPENWRLRLQKACLLFDDNEYRSVLTNRNEYSLQKEHSYAAFAKAASSYHDFATNAKPNKYSVEVYEKWFYAMLGATDLQKVEPESAAATKQTALILAAIKSLGDDLAEDHLKLFSNVVVTRVGMANPGVKFTFLTEGFKITGDRREVTQAKRLHEYYRDLVTELELEAIIDGQDTVSPSQPFGVYIRINHTPEIERESGGFGRFLQNQNALAYAYNFGRPTANYRDKFEEAARVALAEQFEVLSVTFERDTIKSMPLAGVAGKSGWNTTPYAYLLLQPRGTEVDRLPALKMDLDFLDTTGYIVLPISTREVPLNCQSVAENARPFHDLKVTQTLDQREGEEGKLSLEIKASSYGLVPELERIVDLDPGEFEVVEINDTKPLVSSFDKDSRDPIVISERTWEVKLAGKSGLDTKPDEFSFAEQQEGIEIAEWSIMGFDDEDIVEMQPVVKLRGDYGEAATPWGTIVGIASAGLLGIVLLSVMFLTMGGESTAKETQANLNDLTPFALLAALSNQLTSGKLSAAEEAELREEIHNLEQSYFAGANSSPEVEADKSSPKLTSIAKRWL